MDLPPRAPEGLLVGPESADECRLLPGDGAPVPRDLGDGGVLHHPGLDFVTLGRHALLDACNPHSWFVQVRRITVKYGILDPLLVLQQPPTKGRWKSVCRAAVTKWWLTQYRGEAAHLTSLVHFKFNYFSLTKPHNTISTAGSPFEVSRAGTVLLILSGTYISDERSRLWHPQNRDGCCRLCASPTGQPPPPRTLPWPAVSAGDYYSPITLVRRPRGCQN